MGGERSRRKKRYVENLGEYQLHERKASHMAIRLASRREGGQRYKRVQMSTKGQNQVSNGSFIIRSPKEKG